jgi:hypothetical protein
MRTQGYSGERLKTPLMENEYPWMISPRSVFVVGLLLMRDARGET